MDFVAKTKKFLKKYSAILVITFFLLLCGGSIAISMLYTNNMRKSLWNQLVMDITEITAQGGRAFEMYVKNESDTLNALADKLEDYNSNDPDAIEYFNKHIGTEGYYALAVFGAEGDDTVIVYFDDSTLPPVTHSKSDYKDYENSGITDPYLNSYNGHRTLGYYHCFTFKDGRKGILRKGQLVSVINNEFSLSFYNNNGFSYIVKKNGDIMVRPMHRNSNRTSENIYRILEYAENSAGEAKILKDALETHKKGAMLATEGSEERIISFAPLNSIDDWYIVSVIPNTAVSQNIESVLQSSMAITVIVTLVVILVALFFVTWYFSSKRIKAQETEVKYREQLFGILASNTDDVFVLLPHGQFEAEYVSPNISRIMGLDDKVVKTDVREIGDPENSEESGGEHEFNHVKELDNGEMIAFDNTIRKHKKTGETRYFRETVYRASIDGVDKDIIVMSDRTEEKKQEIALSNAMQAATAANNAKSAFLSNMSHDIRTPLNAILGFTELIKRDANDSQKVLQYINKINASGLHLLGLINDVLDMSKIESGKMVLNLQSFSLAEFVNELDIMMRPQTNAKKQTFEIITESLHAENLIGDKLRLNQILINILSNAMKYTPTGGKIVMEISELPRINENFAHLRFSVTDNGMGMSEEYLKQIFNPFTREISSTTNTIQGTGLGMAITKSLVDLLEGSITVKSKPGEGSTFTVEVELRIEAEDVNNEFWQEHGISHALVVDDEQEICDHVKTTLEEVGLKTDFALSGEEAIAFVKQQSEAGENTDLIILDLRMPGMDGIETAQKLREIMPEGTTILILTSYDWSDFEETARAAGIDAFMAKPFFVSNLKHSITELQKLSVVAERQEKKNILDGMHILAAEDNELNAEILAELLSMQNATCEIMENGKLAVDRFNASAENEYDIILMDVQMPVMNGYDATRAIRTGTHPRAKTIPIIAMTANAFAEDINASLESGMDAHIAKPLNIEHLEEVCRQILSKRSAGEEK